MVLTCEEMKRVEADAFARGVSADALMEEAGLGVANAVSQFFPSPGRCVAVCGKGNNAGDALVAARHLAGRGWRIELDFAFAPGGLSPLAAAKLAALRPLLSASVPQSVAFSAPLIILDGLLGIGASGNPREPVAAAIRRIIAFRQEQAAFVFAIDIPSGLDGDIGTPGEPCVKADCTITIAHAKAGLLADEATNYAGRLAVVPVDDLATNIGESVDVSTARGLRRLLPPRDFDTHKGIWGRVGIVAGSRGFLGAARLCSAGALLAGAGLITLYALPDTYALLATAVRSEIMVKPVDSFAEVLEEKCDALAIGPGVGFAQAGAILKLIANVSQPAVVDADALTMLGQSECAALRSCKGQRLLTPHPGEMARLMAHGKLTRREIVAEFTRLHPPVTLLLKGARTAIGAHGRLVAVNSTGNPGMGSAGMGDVLAGVCAAMLARKIAPVDAARLGAWLCGFAAERAVFGRGGSPESLAASDVLNHLGCAFESLRRGEL